MDQVLHKVPLSAGPDVWCANHVHSGIAPSLWSKARASASLADGSSRFDRDRDMPTLRYRRWLGVIRLALKFSIAKTKSMFHVNHRRVTFDAAVQTLVGFRIIGRCKRSVYRIGTGPVHFRPPRRLAGSRGSLPPAIASRAYELGGSKSREAIQIGDKAFREIDLSG